MNSKFRRCGSNPRFVGDPIDVITGSATDTALDLEKPGPLPLQWVRYYSSSHAGRLGLLGWGHTHEFDRCLQRDLDGICYQGPLHEVTGFPDLEVGGSSAVGGLVLARLNSDHYVVSQSGEPDFEFQFPEGSLTGRLVRLRSQRDTIEFAYDEQGRLTTIIDSLGDRIRVEHDRAGRVIQLTMVDPAEVTRVHLLLAYEYDDAGNLIRVTDVHKTVQRLAYERSGLVARRADRNGYSFHFTYDELGRCVHSRGDDGLFEVFLDYDPASRTTLVRRGDGGEWLYQYSELGVLTEITDPYGSVTQYVQDDLGRTIQEIDPNGNVTELHYDADGQHDFRIDPLGYSLPTRDEDPNPPDPLAYRRPESPLQWEFGNLWNTWGLVSNGPSDAALRQFPAAVEDPFAPTIVASSAPTILPAGPAPARADRAPADRAPLVPPGPAERIKYDSNGNLTEHHDSDGSMWRATYTSSNALHQLIDPLGHVTVFEYSSEGLISKVVDPAGTVIEYRYDLRDKLSEVHVQGKVRERYQRDPAGNVVAKLDAHGRRLVRWEIGRGNLETRRVLASGETHEFEYDARGRIVAATAPSGKATFGYHEDGMMQADLRGGKGVVHTFDAGVLQSTTYLGGFKVRYGLDDRGRWQVTDPLGGEHRFEFDARGAITRQLANGDRELCRFDSEGRCLDKAVVRGKSEQPWVRRFEYSPTGDLTAVRDNLHGTTTYSYDRAHRPIEELPPGRQPSRVQYDAAGNLVAQPGLHEVMIGIGNRLRVAKGNRFSYDERDRLSERLGPTSTTHFMYNELDMLCRCEMNGEVWTASYDALCRRVQKTWRGRTTTYYWDDFRLAAEVRHEGSVRIYVYVDEAALVPFLFIEYASLDADPSSGEPYYVYSNQIGVPTRVADREGNLAWSARLSAYGTAEIDPASRIEMPLRFPGHYFDDETGLHYNRFRYYSPELGRYLQVDPLGQAGGINLYAYPVSPLIGVDIDGLADTKVGPPPMPGIHDAKTKVFNRPGGTSPPPDSSDEPTKNIRRPAPDSSDEPTKNIRRPAPDSSDETTKVIRRPRPAAGPPPAPAPRRSGPAAASPPAASAGCAYTVPKGAISPADLIKSGALKLDGEAAHKLGTIRDLYKIANTKTGQRVLAQIRNNHSTSGVSVTIRNGEPASHTGGPGQWNRRDPRTGKPGQGFDSDVKYSPGKNYGDRGNTPSDVVLIHELDHAQRNGSGNNRKDYPNPDPSRFPNAEEHAAVTTENNYRRETQRPLRVDEEGQPTYSELD